MSGNLTRYKTMQRENMFTTYESTTYSQVIAGHHFCFH
jgi:hypothetical protein